MPIVPFDSLPAESRVWVFASDRALDGDEARRLLEVADEFLARWKAHGEPLRAARQWTDDHFLIVGVDPTTANASGCSIDGLFRAIQALGSSMGARLVGGGRVFYRDERGVVHGVTREEFTKLAANGAVTAETSVFDTSITLAGEVRSGFEKAAGETWASKLLG